MSSSCSRSQPCLLLPARGRLALPVPTAPALTGHSGPCSNPLPSTTPDLGGHEGAARGSDEAALTCSRRPRRSTGSPPP